MAVMHTILIGHVVFSSSFHVLRWLYLAEEGSIYRPSNKPTSSVDLCTGFCSQDATYLNGFCPDVCLLAGKTARNKQTKRRTKTTTATTQTLSTITTTTATAVYQTVCKKNNSSNLVTPSDSRDFPSARILQQQRIVVLH